VRPNGRIECDREGDDDAGVDCERQRTVVNPEGATMKLTVNRAIPVTLALAVTAFLLSGVGRFKNAHHGLDAVVGEIVWLGFLIAALALVVLVGVAGFRRLGTRRRAAAGI
jgi:hypothetical protein